MELRDPNLMRLNDGNKTGAGENPWDVLTIMCDHPESYQFTHFRDGSIHLSGKPGTGTAQLTKENVIILRDFLNQIFPQNA